MGEAKNRKAQGLPPKNLKLTDEDKVKLTEMYGTHRLAFLEWPRPFPNGAYSHTEALKMDNELPTGSWAFAQTDATDLATMVARQDKYEIQRYEIDPDIYNDMDELFSEFPDIMVFKRANGLLSLVRVRTDVDALLNR